MSPASPPNAAPHAPAGYGLDDVCFTLFRHYRLILAFVVLGIVVALTVKLTRPPLYLSYAKLMVRYVVQAPPAVSTSNPENVVPTEIGGHTLIAQQAEILGTPDVAAKAAAMVGPEKILAKRGGGANLAAAAGVVSAGITIEPPKTAIITVSFKHPDRDIVQPVLDAVIKTYIARHFEIYQKVDVLADAYKQQLVELSQKLLQTDEELKRLMTESNVLFPDDNEASYRQRLSKVQDELFETQKEVAKHKAMIGNLQPGAVGDGTTNAMAEAPSPERISEYSFYTSELEKEKKEERELLLQFTDAHPKVQAVHSRIKTLNGQKAALERECPGLANLGISSAKGGTNSAGMDVAAELAQIRGLNATVAVLGEFLSNTVAEASHVMEIKPRLTELKRKHEELDKSYHAILSNLEQAQALSSSAASKVSMSMVQPPTPPRLDSKKTMKLVGMALAGCIGLGLGLAFLFDMVLDRTIRRSADVERHLRLPVFLTIPDTAWSRQMQLPRWLQRGREPGPAAPSSGNGHGDPIRAVAQWNPEHHLQTYTEGLRERLMTYFEIHNLNLKKPKLVALTGCGKGSGVTTLATGLAAALSNTGDGNVLLVDMNVDAGVARSFHKGKPGCGAAEGLGPESGTGTSPEDNMPMPTFGDHNDKLVKALPNRFNHLVPKLQASDYDYIVFDMPPVSPTSATPRLAAHMDLVLMVLESERTGQHLAARAGALMRESRVNMAVVLNKYRQHVPAQISQEL